MNYVKDVCTKVLGLDMFKTDNLPQEQIDSVVNSLKGE